MSGVVRMPKEGSQSAAGLCMHTISVPVFADPSAISDVVRGTR